VGLLSKVLKVFDNPLTRAGLGAVGLSSVGAALSSAAGNQAATNAQLGAGYGAVYQGGSAVVPQVISGTNQMLLGNLFPSIPGVTSQTPMQKTANKLVNAVMSPTGMMVVPATRRRRMNPANIKAARRAIRRIRSTRRILQRIERMLPTRTVHSRRK